MGTIPIKNNILNNLHEETHRRDLKQKICNERDLILRGIGYSYPQLRISNDFILGDFSWPTHRIYGHYNIRFPTYIRPEVQSSYTTLAINDSNARGENK